MYVPRYQDPSKPKNRTDRQTKHKAKSHGHIEPENKIKRHENAPKASALTSPCRLTSLPRTLRHNTTPLAPPDVIPILNRDALGHMVDLVNTHQPRRQLKHVVAQRDDNELGIARALLDVGSDNGDLKQDINQSAIARVGKGIHLQNSRCESPAPHQSRP